MMRNGLLMAAAVLVVDQASKYWILNGLDLPALGSVAVLPVLNLTMVWNHGVTFGMFNGLGRAGPMLLTAVAIAVVVLLGVWMRSTERVRVELALGAIAGGAIGNVIDRLRFGAVVDFIHAHAFGWSWYVFNIADAAIVCGVGVLLLDSLLDRSRA
jgi:signal peptidase II